MDNIDLIMKLGRLVPRFTTLNTECIEFMSRTEKVVHIVFPNLLIIGNDMYPDTTLDRIYELIAKEQCPLLYPENLDFIDFNHDGGAQYVYEVQEGIRISVVQRGERWELSLLDEEDNLIEKSVKRGFNSVQVNKILKRLKEGLEPSF